MKLPRLSVSVRVGLCFLLVVATAVRLYAAWALRHTDDPDCGVVFLMAKHIAEGKDWPVFFYGQAYMGSLEPTLSALFCLLLGPSAFAVFLGSALVGLLVLPLIYLWARDAAGPKAGLAALAFCLVGPREFLFFEVVPRGGYPMVVLLGTAVVYLTCRMLATAAGGALPSRRTFFGLGLLAGAGWWSNPLMLYALATVSLLFLLAWRRRIFTWRWLAAAAGFFLASAPFWIWNARHGWRSLGFLSEPGGSDFGEGVDLFFSRRLHRLIGVQDLPASLVVLAIALYALLLLAGLAYALSRRGRGLPRYASLGALAFLVVGTLMFSFSRFAYFNTARYQVPLVPALAVLFGCAIAWMSGRLKYGLAWLPLAGILAFQIPTLRLLPHMQETYARRLEWATELGAFLEQEDIRTLLTPFAYYGLNFKLDEQFVFYEGRNERYAPYAVAGELDDHSAVLNNFARVSDFFNGAGGLCSAHIPGAHVVHYGFQPPELEVAELEPARIASLRDARGHDLQGTLLDRDFDSIWSPDEASETEEWIECVFTDPIEIAGVRVLSDHPNGYPQSWQVLGLEPGSDQWIPLTVNCPFTAYYWSGPRLYYGGKRYRLDSRFTPRRLNALRFVDTDLARRRTWRVAEIEVFAPAPPLPSPTESLPALLAALRESGTQTLYCDRWEANAIYEASGDTLAVPLHERTFRSRTHQPPDLVALSPTTAFLAHRRDAAATRESLLARGIVMSESEIGPWVLWRFAPDQWLERYSHEPGLLWVGYAALRSASKRYAYALAQEATELAAREGWCGAALEKALAAVSTYPGAVFFFPDLAGQLAYCGQAETAERIRSLYADLYEPAQPADVDFGRPADLLGLSFEQTAVAAGRSFPLRYYWRSPPEFDPTQFAVFVHIRRGDYTFQDDHTLLAEVRPLDRAFQPQPGVFVEARNVRVPENTPEGEYEIWLGLYDRRTGIRLRPRTDLDVERRAVKMPVTIRIEKPTS